MSDHQHHTLCSVCQKGDGISGTIRSFKTKYGYRMHLLKVHSLKEKDGRLVKARSPQKG